MPEAWDPDQYARFSAQRREPFFDLAAMVRSRPSMKVVDLGCGSGELTWVLHRWLGAGETIGMDDSASMLSRCAVYRGPGLSFVKGDIRTFDEGSFDLVFSNAALQWVEGHEELLPRLAARVAPIGQIAVQMPANDDHLSHRVAAELAGESPFREALGGHVRKSPVLAPERYAEILHRQGFKEQNVRLQVYGHLLPSREEVVEWVKGTLLTDYKSRLSDALYGEFLGRYRERLVARLPDERPFFYPYKRILFWAAR